MTTMNQRSKKRHLDKLTCDRARVNKYAWSSDLLLSGFERFDVALQAIYEWSIGLAEFPQSISSKA